MARQRFIWPTLWDDPALGRVSELAFILYVGCFSNADDNGRLIGDPVFLKSVVFRYRDVTVQQVLEARDELAAACGNFCVYGAGGDHIAFINWFEYQNPKYPQPSRLPAPPVRQKARRKRTSQKPSRNDSVKPPGTLGEGSSTGRDGLGSTTFGSTEPTPPNERPAVNGSPSSGKQGAHFVDPTKVCEACGEDRGHGCLEDCPTRYKPSETLVLDSEPERIAPPAEFAAVMRKPVALQSEPVAAAVMGKTT